MRVFLGTLWSSIKQTKVSYVYDGEHGIALHVSQGNRASSCGEGEVSVFFSSCGRNLEYILELLPGWKFKTPVCSAKSGLLSNYQGQFRNVHEPWQGNTDTSRCELGD